MHVQRHCQIDRSNEIKDTLLFPLTEYSLWWQTIITVSMSRDILFVIETFNMKHEQVQWNVQYN
jgi:hypothetical protein